MTEVKTRRVPMLQFYETERTFQLKLNRAAQRLSGFYPGTYLGLEFEPTDKRIGVKEVESWRKGYLLTGRGHVSINQNFRHWFRETNLRELLRLKSPAVLEKGILWAHFPEMTDNIERYTVPLGEYVRAYLDRNNMSGAMLAERTGLSRMHIYNITHTQAFPHQADTVRRVRIALGLPPDALLMNVDQTWLVDPSVSLD